MEISKSIESLLSGAGVKNVVKGRKIVYISAAVVGGVIIFLVARKIKIAADRKADVKDAKRYDVVDRNEDMGNVEVITRNLTITDGDAILIATNLLAAMDRFGTDEKAIVANLKQCNTKDDLLLVMKKFGTKPYSGVGIAESWLTRTGYKNLNGWLRAELSKSELKPVIEIYNALGVPF